MVERKKIGLALGGGGARGLAHIGVLKELVRNNVPIDIVAGSSMGALIGGLYCSWNDVGRIETLADNVDEWDLLKMFVDPTWKGGLVRGEKFEQKIKNLGGKEMIEEMPVKFAAVATDVNTAEPVVIRKGSFAEAVRASASFPVLFQPVEKDEHVLVDGGLSDPVPVEVVKKMGADIVIAVNLDSVYFQSENRRGKNLSTLSILRNSLFLLRYHLAKKEVRQADIVINPTIPYVEEFDFRKREGIIAGGEKTAREMMELIKKKLA